MVKLATRKRAWGQHSATTIRSELRGPRGVRRNLVVQCWTDGAVRRVRLRAQDAPARCAAPHRGHHAQGDPPPEFEERRFFYSFHFIFVSSHVPMKTKRKRRAQMKGNWREHATEAKEQCKDKREENGKRTKGERPNKNETKTETPFCF